MTEETHVPPFFPVDDPSSSRSTGSNSPIPHESNKPIDMLPILLSEDEPLSSRAVDGVIDLIEDNSGTLFALGPRFVRQLQEESSHKPNESPSVAGVFEAAFQRRNIQTIKPDEPGKHTYDYDGSLETVYFNPESTYIEKGTYGNVDRWEAKIRIDNADGHSVHVLSLSLPDRNAFQDAHRRWFNGPFEKSGVCSNICQIQEVRDGEILWHAMELHYDETKQGYIWHPVGRQYKHKLS